MAKSKKNDHAEHDPLLVLRMYLYFRRQVGYDVNKTLDDIIAERERITGNEEFSKNQIRKVLGHLVSEDFIKYRKDPHQNNKGFYWLPSKSGPTKIDKQTFYELTLQELFEVFTGRIDNLDKSSLLNPVNSPKNERLNGFLSVSSEDEFYFFDDREFETINDLFQNYSDQYLTRLTLYKNFEPDEYLVIQVRLWSDGFVLICLKPREQGASVRYYKLQDVLDVQIGRPVSVNNQMQLQDAIKDIIKLSNKKLKEIAKNT